MARRSFFPPNNPQARPGVWRKKNRSPYCAVLNAPRATPRCSVSIPPGEKLCRPACKTAPPPTHCRRSAILTSSRSRQSTHRVGLDGIISPVQTPRLAPVGPQEPPARRCVSLSLGTPRRAGPPYGLPAQAATKGVPFACRLTSNIIPRPPRHHLMALRPPAGAIVRQWISTPPIPRPPFEQTCLRRTGRGHVQAERISPGW